MGDVLGAPKGAPFEWATSIWRYRAGEIPEHRPFTTGDVFKAIIDVPLKRGAPVERTFVVLQHPCTMRSDGVNLRDGILVAVVTKGSKISSWPTDRVYNKMPLPHLVPKQIAGIDSPPAVDDAVECWEAEFETFALASATDLDAAKRIAVMDLEGIGLLLQRLTHYLTRAAPALHLFVESVKGADLEVEILEEWIGRAIASGCDVTQATMECVEWLRTEENGTTRQKALDRPESRHRVARAATLESKERYGHLEHGE